MKLYEISDEIEAILKPDSDEEVNENDLDLLFMKFNEKVGNCIAVLKNMKARKEAIKEERIRLQTSENAMMNKIKNLQEYVIKEMKRVKTKKIHVGIHSAYIAPNPMSVNVNMEELSERWVRIPPPLEPTPNAKEIIKHIKKTGEIPKGVEIINKEHLRVNW